MDPFLKACSANGPFRLSVESKDEPGVERHVFHQPFALIGRDSRADLWLNHPEVSRRHAYLQMVAGEIYCVDLYSRTGSLPSADPNAAARRLSKIDHDVRIGPYRVKVLPNPVGAIDPADDDPYQAVSPDAGPLEVTLEESSASFAWRLEGTLALVGRAEECDVRLADKSVSRLHCSLIRSATGVWIVDLLGRGGVSVNGGRIRSARLVNGDVVQIGRFLLRVLVEGPFGGRFASPIAGRSGAIARQMFPALPGAVGGFSDLAPFAALPGPGNGSGLPAYRGHAASDLALAGDSGGGWLSPFVQQFGSMQRQMTDQFQQMMMMMVQMFGDLHRDQMSQIHEELDEIRRLTDELSRLREQMTAPSTATNPSYSPVSASESAAVVIPTPIPHEGQSRIQGRREPIADLGANPLARNRSETTRHERPPTENIPKSAVESFSKPASFFSEPSPGIPAREKSPPEARPSPLPTSPKQPNPTFGSSPNSARPTVDLDPRKPVVPGRPSSSPTSAPKPPTRQQPQPQNPPKQPAPAASSTRHAGRTDFDMHFALHERIKQIETEQKTRWQKILDVLTGSRG